MEKLIQSYWIIGKERVKEWSNNYQLTQYMNETTTLFAVISLSLLTTGFIGYRLAPRFSSVDSIPRICFERDASKMVFSYPWFLEAYWKKRKTLKGVALRVSIIIFTHWDLLTFHRLKMETHLTFFIAYVTQFFYRFLFVC